jgi:hypothetical protein
MQLQALPTFPMQPGLVTLKSIAYNKQRCLYIIVI